ncbi:alpha/beta hydrolase [Schlesneria paludicola]|uniref:alpha/beta hydrolase n=1 Tax=Schlesneria paludicola TaxID=360056 RepID=UPI0012F80D41|nr:alpha/beta hydrolase [Schlesneria paludicola]
MRYWLRLLVVCGFVITRTVHAVEPVAVQYGKDSKQSLNVYRPAAEEKGQSLPVVIWVHGGGWRNGDKDNRAGINLCQTWAKARIVVVGLDYRLTPAVVHPAHVEDVAAGIAWVHKHIAEYGGDPKRVFLLGHSAGAHLVALVATAPNYLQAHDLSPKSALAGVMAIDTASYDLTTTRTPAVKKMISDAFGNEAKTLNEASPLQQARKNPDDCPPFVIAAVKQRPEAVSESKALSAVLPQSTLVTVDYPGTGQLAAHGLIAKELADFEKDLTKRLLAFVKDTPASVK